jgi:hypothetical protein
MRKAQGLAKLLEPGKAIRCQCASSSDKFCSSTAMIVFVVGPLPQISPCTKNISIEPAVSYRLKSSQNTPFTFPEFSFQQLLLTQNQKDEEVEEKGCPPSRLALVLCAFQTFAISTSGFRLSHKHDSKNASILRNDIRWQDIQVGPYVPLGFFRSFFLSFYPTQQTASLPMSSPHSECFPVCFLVPPGSWALPRQPTPGRRQAVFPSRAAVLDSVTDLVIQARVLIS